MNKYHSYPLTLTNTSRDEILTYFNNSYDLFERMFDILKNDSVFYKQSEPTRHPMIFYFGHTATFFINKLILAGVIKERINPVFESIFAVGVDEMRWDDLDSSHYSWPSVQEVREYRLKVRSLIEKLIKTLPLNLPIKPDNAFWIILMGIEHERIHIETSSVLHRQMPIELITEVDDFDIFDDMSDDFLPNMLVDISGDTITLGKDETHHLYGWDNEYGSLTCKVENFKVSKYLVSNGEFLEFVQNGGYENHKYWDNDGLLFLKHSNAKYPRFWVKDKNGYKYRTLTKIIDMPLNWPVDVNALEAHAFLRYISIRDNKKYDLPTEAQWYRLYEHAKFKDVPDFDDTKANINLSYHVSACSVDRFEHNGICDIVGNVWQWTKTPIGPFDGFKIHYAYDDFSTPTFDDKHFLIKGGSFISTGNEIMKHSRYAFRGHFHQHAGFRYVIANNKEESNMKDVYESDELVSQYCEFQYGEEYFSIKNFAVTCASKASSFAVNHKKALDLGCATGRASFELGKNFDMVEGVDFSARFISVAARLQNEGYLAYHTKQEGDLYTKKKITLKELGYDDIKDKISFWQGDACNLKPTLTSYDLIMATNLIDRLYNPRLFLDTIHKRLKDEGILVITSPYTWQETSTKKEFWLGGYKNKDKNEVHTLDTLKEILSLNFTLVHLEDVEFVLRESARKYQHTISQMSVWKKR